MNHTELPSNQSKGARSTERDAAGPAAFERELHSRLGTYIKQAEQALMAAKSAALRPLDLTVPQYAVLMAIKFVPGQSATQLARVSGVTQQTMASTLSTLEARALIDRRTSTVHAKVKTVHLTEAGVDLVARADRRTRAIEDTLAAAFTAAEHDTFRELSTRAVTVLRAISSDGP